ncbi:hypothetical protein NX059_005492 [Plenodomus lindquistii]|nr:hypothetical protein NX059_005492 [Plenodomus lindquistii]
MDALAESEMENVVPKIANGESIIDVPAESELNALVESELNAIVESRLDVVVGSKADPVPVGVAEILVETGDEMAPEIVATISSDIVEEPETDSVDVAESEGVGETDSDDTDDKDAGIDEAGCTEPDTVEESEADIEDDAESDTVREDDPVTSATSSASMPKKLAGSEDVTESELGVVNDPAVGCVTVAEARAVTSAAPVTDIELESAVVAETDPGLVVVKVPETELVAESSSAKDIAVETSVLVVAEEYDEISVEDVVSIRELRSDTLGELSKVTDVSNIEFAIKLDSVVMTEAAKIEISGFDVVAEMNSEVTAGLDSRVLIEAESDNAAKADSEGEGLANVTEVDSDLSIEFKDESVADVKLMSAVEVGV